MIKLTGIFLFLFIIILVMCRCNEKDDEPQPETIYVVTVSDISITPGEHSMQVSWKAPENSSRLSYYLEWQGKNIDTSLYTATTPNTNYTIHRLYNDDYTVKVVAISKELCYSLPVEITGRPEEDRMAPEIIEEFIVSPSVSTVYISYTKPTAEDFEYVIAKVKKEGEENWFAIDTIQKTDSITFIEGLDLLSKYSYSIQAFDYNGNASGNVTGSFTTREDHMLDKLNSNGKPIWKIDDFSSQETKGDNGYASNAIDGNNKTFWHSVWNGGDFNDKVSTGTLPQYIVINLQEEVEPSAVILYRRDGNAAGPTLVRIESTLYGDKWNDLGTYELDGQNNGALVCNLRVIYQAQYIKITILKVASGNYATLREIEVKALVPLEE